LTNQQGQQQGNVGINGQQQGIDSDIANRNDNDNRNINTNLLNNNQGQDQGQAMEQGQIAVGQVQVQDNSSQEYKAFSFAPPGIAAVKGTSSANMYSIFGGIGLSQTEEYTIAIEKLAVIERLQGAGYITEEQARNEALVTYIQLDSATQPKRILGIFGKTRGRHLLNLMGLLSWDSYWAEGQTPFTKSKPWPKKEVKPTTPDINDGSGNEGFIN